MSQKLAYFIGIKGVGMSALAVLYKESGYQVTGSDTEGVFVTNKILDDHDIHYFNVFNAKNLENLKPEIVVISAVYGDDNPEVSQAKRDNLNIKYYSEAVSHIASDKKMIAVSGVHGKTTTSALTAFLLDKAGLDPSFLVGSGDVFDLKTNARKGNGDYFVVEADEYRKSPENSQSKFLDFNPFIAIISSIELDHPDVFSTIEEIYDTFYKFACRVPRNGFIVLCIDYQKNKKLMQSLADRNFETYGFDLSAKWRVMNVAENSFTTFSLENAGKLYGPFEISAFGRHNVLNSTAAIITALKIGVSESEIKKNIKEFKGVKRRFEEIGEVGNIKIYDDYAHHPTAISTTLEAAKMHFPGEKIWCIFQPHTFSRTEKLLTSFGKAFRAADKVIITDIYSSREKEGKITGEDLAFEIKKHQQGVRYFSDREKIMDYVLETIKGPAILITMGAGDIYKLANQLKNAL